MKYSSILVALLLLTSCGERKLTPEEQGKCIEAIDETSITGKVQNFYVDEYGYLCCLVSPVDLDDAPDLAAELEYIYCCKPPIRGVKMLNLEGNQIGIYTKP